MVTIVTSVNTTSQNTIDSVDFSVSTRNSRKHYDSWLLYNVHYMDFSFELDDLMDNNINFTIARKYFRFTTKFIQERNHIFILLADTYEENLIAIQNSGFGTSPGVIFMILVSNCLNNSSYILKHFGKGFMGKDGETEPFNAALIFYEANKNQTKLGIFCLTCLGPKIKFMEINLQEITFKNLKSVSNQINQNGNGRKVPLRGPLASMDPTLEQCLHSFHSPSTREFLYYTLTQCGSSVGVYAPVVRHLNISMILPGNLQTLEEVQISRWSFNIANGEACLFNLPNQFAKTRGLYIIPMSSPLETFVCLDPQQLRIFHIFFFVA